MKLAQASLPIVACALSFAVGWFASSRRAAQSFREIVAQHKGAPTLGSVMPSDQRANVSQAYSDPARALREFDHYTWEPAEVPAPFVGYLPAPGVHDNARITSLGFRDERELADPKPAGTFRVFLSGGSTVFGVGAPSQDTTISALLEKRINAELAPANGVRYEVFAVAAPAWTSTQQRISIENVLSDRAPDLVVLLGGVNDVHWAWRGVDVMWFRTYADDFFRALLLEALARAGEQAPVDVVEPPGEPVEPSVVGYRFEKNQRLASYSLAIRGIPFVVCLQPCLPISKRADAERTHTALEPQDDYFAACYHEMRGRMGSMRMDNFRFVDLSQALDATYAREHLYIDSYHFGDKGNARVADAIFEAVRDKLVPARKQ